ncbi:MAG: 3-hydroxybutyryl-CoA dehydrogenase [Terriglobia bacterium]
MQSSLHRIGVVGAGTMGGGITQVLAQRGLSVVLCDSVPAQLEKTLQTIDRNLTRAIEKNQLDATAREIILQRIRTHTTVEALAEAELVIEAVSESFPVKREILTALDKHCPAETILATNTSSISITRLAAATQRPERVVGMQFRNPVPVMKLVEIIRGLRTSAQTVATVLALVTQLEKVPVEVMDSPGFVSNRVLMPMINEAVFCVYEGVGDPQAVDQVMKMGMNHPLGPLALADLIGLDVCLNIMETLYEGFSDSKYRPCPLLKQMVAAGKLGRKSGEGFYSYGH